MELISSATVTCQDAQNTQVTASGCLGIQPIDNADCLILFDQPPAAIPLRTKAGLMADVIRENPGTAVRSGVTAVGIGLVKSAVSAITRANCAHARVTNESLRDLSRLYEKKLEAFHARELWRMPLCEIRQLEYPGLETIIAACHSSGPFTLTFDSAATARAFFTELSARLKGSPA